MGDIAGRYMFTHAANFESEYLAQLLTGKTRDPIDYGPMPHAVFTLPEIAGVGATEDELKSTEYALRRRRLIHSPTPPKAAR